MACGVEGGVVQGDGSHQLKRKGMACGVEGQPSVRCPRWSD